MPLTACDDMQEHDEWMAGFHSTLVSVNAVSKGTRTGGIRRFTAVSVVGNYQVAFRSFLAPVS